MMEKVRGDVSANVYVHPCESQNDIEPNGLCRTLVGVVAEEPDRVVIDTWTGFLGVLTNLTWNSQKITCLEKLQQHLGVRPACMWRANLPKLSHARRVSQNETHPVHQISQHNKLLRSYCRPHGKSAQPTHCGPDHSLQKAYNLV